MLDIIQLLPDAIANQIAAGEVVQRPASVVKELLENSIDAKATKIQVVVREAGKTLIQIIDNGLGMSTTDARMSFERHATSKIRTTEDIFNIRTMGFRGEALASIAAVAQVEMRTRREIDEMGILIEVEGSTLKKQESISTNIGTSIAVKNLFFNVPARRNFLKTNAVEMRHILDEFQRVALAHPQIEFILFHNDTEIYNLPEGKLSHRIVGIFGKSYREQLIDCEEETPLVRVSGYVGKPEQSKKTRGEQFFFANKRYIKHSYLHHAVVTAFDGLLPKEYNPFYVIFLEIEPIHIDINVHPTKTEIKFDDERTVYAIVQAAVRRALGSHNIAPVLDFDNDVNFNLQKFAEKNNLIGNNNIENDFENNSENNSKNINKTTNNSNNLGNYVSNNNRVFSSGFSSDNYKEVLSQEKLENQEKNKEKNQNNQENNTENNQKNDLKSYEKTPTQKSNVDNWQKIYQNFKDNIPEENITKNVLFEENNAQNYFKNNLNNNENNDNNYQNNDNENIKSEITFRSSIDNFAGDGEDTKATFQLNNRYIVTQIRSGLMLIDQHLAHQRILYDRYLLLLTNKKGVSQQLLFPIKIIFNPADFAILEEMKEEILGLGFVFDVIKTGEIMLLGIPAGIPSENEKNILESLIEQFKMHQSEITLDTYEQIARALAQRTAIRQVKLAPMEINSLIAQLFASSNPNYTPIGEKIIVTLDMGRVAQLFF